MTTPEIPDNQPATAVSKIAPRSAAMPRRLALLGIVALGLGLRLIGIRFGDPCAGCRPDEETCLRQALFLLEGTHHIHFFNYPPGMMLLDAAWIRCLGILGILPDDALKSWAENPMPFHIAVRVMAAMLGTSTIAAVYVASRRLFGVGAGLASAALLAVMPLHVLHSHFGTLDVPGTAFAAWALAFAVLAGKSRPRVRFLVLAAAAAGIAAGIKYPMGIALFWPLTRSFRYPSPGRAVAAVLIAFSAAFLIAAPTFLLQFRDARQGISIEAGSQQLGRSNWTGPHPLVYHVTRSIWNGGGELPVILGVIGLALLLRSSRQLAFLATPPVALLLVHGFTGNVFFRYMLPVLPVLAVGAGAFWRIETSRRARTAIVLLFAVGILWSGMRALAYDLLLTRKDTRGELLDALADGRLPRDLPVVLPAAPFQLFPMADMKRLVETFVLIGPPDEPCNRKIRDAVLRMVEDPSGERKPTEAMIFDANSMPSIERDYAGREILMIIPTTFGGYFDWHHAELRRLRERAARGELTLERVLSLDPNAGRALPARDQYDRHDFWFVPFPNPSAVDRPGPMIDVYRVRFRAP